MENRISAYSTITISCFEKYELKRMIAMLGQGFGPPDNNNEFIGTVTLRETAIQENSVIVDVDDDRDIPEEGICNKTRKNVREALREA